MCVGESNILPINMIVLKYLCLRYPGAFCFTIVVTRYTSQNELRTSHTRFDIKMTKLDVAAQVSRFYLELGIFF